MFSSWCTWCGDEFGVGPDQSVPVDPEEPRFCSDRCEERHSAAVDAEEIYREGRYGSAPVWL